MNRNTKLQEGKIPSFTEFTKMNENFMDKPIDKLVDAIYSAAGGYLHLPERKRIKIDGEYYGVNQPLSLNENVLEALTMFIYRQIDTVERNIESVLDAYLLSQFIYIRTNYLYNIAEEGKTKSELKEIREFVKEKRNRFRIQDAKISKKNTLDDIARHDKMRHDKIKRQLNSPGISRKSKRAGGNAFSKKYLLGKNFWDDRLSKYNEKEVEVKPSFIKDELGISILSDYAAPNPKIGPEQGEKFDYFITGKVVLENKKGDKSSYNFDGEFIKMPFEDYLPEDQKATLSITSAYPFVKELVVFGIETDNFGTKNTIVDALVGVAREYEEKIMNTFLDEYNVET
jgi:hypothetical protein